MTTRCKTCAHADRARIELALAAGVSTAAVAQKFGLGRYSVGRHWKAHVTAQRRADLIAGPLAIAQLAERAAEEGVSLLDSLAIVRSALMARFLAASECDDRTGTALIAGRLIECLRTIARLTGELQAATATVTHNTLVMNGPAMADLQAMLITRLQPFPEARAAVIAGLEQLSQRSLPSRSAAPVLIEREAIDVQ